MPQPPAIIDGVLHLDGEPTFLWSADYPYYRDQRDDWSRQLDNLKKMGVRIVTFYIPWRHHAPADPQKGGAYDFSGKRIPRTDVLHFIRLIRDKGMLCVAKPGPFVHAELHFGGLPDYVDAGRPENGIEALRIADDRTPEWSGRVLPAPLGERYLGYARDWLSAVDREVLRGNQYPDGPVIAVQILNEGLYSSGPCAIRDIHYCESAVRHYREFLREKYESVERYNETHETRLASFDDIEQPREWRPPDHPKGLRVYIDWAEFGAAFYKRILKTYTSFMPGVRVPFVLNPRPPYAPAGHLAEIFMSRFNYVELEPLAHYGFTNWAGLVAYNREAYELYRMTAKIRRGINMEENWGFESYDPPHYWKTQPSFFQSMAYMAWGATGMNIYLGVSTDEWDDDLAPGAGGVYMNNHPIAEDGTFRPSFWTVRQMSAFLEDEGRHLVAEPPRYPIAWGFYRPYAHLGAWGMSADDARKAGLSTAPAAANRGWNSFLNHCATGGVKNGIAYIDLQPVDTLLRHRILFLNGADWMDRATQAKLVEYVERGGVLAMAGRVPGLDENFKTHTALKDRVFSPGGQSGKGRGIFLDNRPFENVRHAIGDENLIATLAARHAGVANPSEARETGGDPDVDVEEYFDSAHGIQYVYVLTRKSRPARHAIRYTDEHDARREFTIRLTSFTAALVGIERGQIRSAILKCTNDHENEDVTPFLQVGDAVLAADRPADLAMSRRGDVYTITAANVRDGSARVTLPIPPDRVLSLDRVGDSGIPEAVEWRRDSGGASFEITDMKFGGVIFRLTSRPVCVKTL